jgi:pimeloyl-ACP methyl ester carboxylesterase
MVVKLAEAGGPIHYADYGGSGRPMVLVHGLGGSHLNWMAVGGALARSHRVLAPDLIGFGYTPPAGRRATIHQNLGALERFLVQVVREPAILVGNSMGGMLSAYVAARRPEWVESLVLVDPACPNPRFAGVSAVVVAFFGALLAPGLGARYVRRRALRMGPEVAVDQTLAVVCADPRRIDPAVRQAHIDLTRYRMREMPWSELALVEAAKSLLSAMVRPRRYFETLGRVKAPTLLVQGAEDRLVPLASVQQIAERRPDWEVRVLPGVGHVPMMEAPEQFLGVLEGWLEGLEPARAG